MVLVRTVTNFYEITTAAEPVGSARRVRKHTDAYVEEKLDEQVNKALQELSDAEAFNRVVSVTPVQSLYGNTLVVTVMIAFDAEEGFEIASLDEEVAESDEAPELSDGRNKITSAVFAWIKTKLDDGELSVSEIVDTYGGELSKETVRKIRKTKKFTDYYKN